MSTETIDKEIAQIGDAVKELGKTIETGYATKNELAKHAEAFAALSAAMNSKRLAEKTHPIFGDMQLAKDFIDVLKGAINDSPLARGLKKESEFYVEKQDLNTYGSGTGLETVPTAISNVFSMLISQYGVARKYATVYNDVHGNLTLTKRNGTSTAAYTASGGVNEEDIAVTPNSMGTAAVTLSPKQISAISLISDKLLYASAINVAENVVLDLVEQVGILEDNTVVKGDGTSAYGGTTGINNDSAFPNTNVAAASWNNLDEILGLVAKVHESVQNSPNAAYFMSGATLAKIRQFKASTAGSYFLDPTTGQFNLAGKPIVIWNRMNTLFTAGQIPVYFGDMRRAWTVGLGRDMSIKVDYSVKFLNNQAAFRLTEDYHAVAIQPTALAKLTLTS